MVLIFEGPGAMGGYEKFEAVDLVELAKHSADMAIKKSNAPDSPSGNMTVVLGNAFGGVLFHELAVILLKLVLLPPICQRWLESLVRRLQATL